MKEIEVLSKEDAISIVKENKTEVDYFIFDEFEVHINKIPPKSIQEWHKHMVIEEVIVITAGEVLISWKEGIEIKNQVLTKGFIVRVKKSIHTIKNETNNWAEFIVYRMVPSGNIKREIIKNDKVIEPHNP